VSAPSGRGPADDDPARHLSEVALAETARRSAPSAETARWSAPSAEATGRGAPRFAPESPFRIEAHLARCAVCRARVAAYAALERAVDPWFGDAARAPDAR